MKKVFLGFLSLFFLISCGEPGSEQPGESLGSPSLKIATWNIEHLREQEGVGDRPRTAEDFAMLAEIAAELDADVIALQEVESVKAVAKVFPASEYQILVTDRHGRWSTQKTGFAVRKGLNVQVNGQYQYLDVKGDGNMRYGLDITVEANGRKVRLMSVHLKARCLESSDPKTSEHCEERLAQTEPLENWIDKRAIEGDVFVVLGDFNRRYDSREDKEWANLDDSSPEGADLMRVTEGRHPACMNGKFNSFIDHIVLGTKASEMLIPNSFQETTFGGLVSSDQKSLSDHCPISVRLSLE